MYFNYKIWVLFCYFDIHILRSEMIMLHYFLQLVNVYVILVSFSKF